MKLIMTLLVRDELDIIRDHLEYHLSRGVDFFVITNNLSADGTRDVLEEYVRRGLVRLIDEQDDRYRQTEWVSRMARLAYSDYQADWVINSDADEFWWPKFGNLKDALATIAPNYQALAAAVLHFIAIPGNGPAIQRMIIRNRNRDKLKVCHRGLANVTVAYGNHSLIEPIVQTFPDKWLITVLHFPRRNFEQYRTKVRNGGKALLNNPEVPGSLWHARYDDLQKGRLEEYWKKNVEVGWVRLGWQMLTRKVVIDKRLANYLKALPHHP